MLLTQHKLVLLLYSLTRFYYPRMVPDEALLFKVFDSEKDVPRFVFHTAFDDPTAPVDAPPRKSIEVRTIALWD